MKDVNLSSFQSKLGHSFTNESLLEHSLTHRSFSKNHNERLEFLGDSLVNTIVAERLFQLYPDAPEGHLSAMRSALVRKETLAEIALQIDLGSFLKLGGGTLKTGGHRLDSILADAYEALIAAIYLDSDWQTCSSVVLTHFHSRFDGLDNLTQVRDAKSQLQEWLQAQGQNVPKYDTLDVDGPGHAQRFRVRCLIDSIPGDFLGEGTNRRAAEQQAAGQALEHINARAEQNVEQ